MALELVYTSATRGLRPGTSGFCTVATTAGFPASLVPRLEALAGYRPAPSGRGLASLSFWRLETPSGPACVVGRAGPAPVDHTGRANKIAAFLVLSEDELPACGPARLLAQPGLLRESWSQPPGIIERPMRVPDPGPGVLRTAAAWGAATGDPGWAGVVASAFLRDRSRPFHVVVPESLDPLPLMEEVAALLPDWARWRATFSTYFMQAVAGTPCSIRFCVDGTPAAAAARASKGHLIDLVRRPGVAPDSRFVRMARTGLEEPEDLIIEPVTEPDLELEPSPEPEAEPAEPPFNPARRIRASWRETVGAPAELTGEGSASLPARGRRNAVLASLGILAVVMAAIGLLVRTSGSPDSLPAAAESAVPLPAMPGAAPPDDHAAAIGDPAPAGATPATIAPVQEAAAASSTFSSPTVATGTGSATATPPEADRAELDRLLADSFARKGNAGGSTSARQEDRAPRASAERNDPPPLDAAPAAAPASDPAAAGPAPLDVVVGEDPVPMVLPAGRLALGLQDARRKPLPGPGTVDASGRAEVLVGAAVVVEFARMDGGSMKVGARIASEPDIRRRMGTLMTEVQSIDRELDGLRDPSRLRALQSRRGDAVAENAMLSRATKAPFPRSGEWWLLIDSGGRRCAEFRVVLRKDGRR